MIALPTATSALVRPNRPRGDASALRQLPPGRCTPPDRLEHTPYPRRGQRKDGHGAAGQNCVACHQSGNSANGQVPGPEHWHMAPAIMSWRGLKAGEIRSQMKDPARNGNRRRGAQVIEHRSADPLVLWAWWPGSGRNQPPMSHADFVAAVRTWTDTGMPCPE